MADVMDAFFRGHAAGQAEKEHAQQLEENKLRAMILKHELARIPIENALRARELAAQNLQFLHGQPAADIPSDTVTTQQPNLPAQNLAGMMTGLMRARMGSMANASGAPEQPSPEETPAFTPAPAAQQTTPGTNPVTSRVARAIDIPGVPDLGVGGVSVRPKSAEDLIRTMIATELAKPYTLAEGGRRFVGGREVARGGSKEVVVTRGGTLVDPENPTKPLATGQPYPERPISINGRLVDPVTHKVISTFPPQARPGDAGQADRDAVKIESHQRFAYSQEVASGWKKQADAMRTWQKAHDNSMFDADTKQVVDAQTHQPLGEMPTYEPPSFEEWQADHPAPASAGGTKPAAAGKTAAPPDGTTGTINGKPVVWKTIPGKGAGWVPITAPPARR